MASNKETGTISNRTTYDLRREREREIEKFLHVHNDGARSARLDSSSWFRKASSSSGPFLQARRSAIFPLFFVHGNNIGTPSLFPCPPNDIRLHARGHVINIFHRPSILDAALITLQLRRGSHCNPRPTIGKSLELAAPCDKRYNFRGPFGDRNVDSLAENGVVIERTWQIFGVNALFTESRAWWIHPLAVWSKLREWIFEGVFARWAAL